ncbi:MAG TPA: SPFH domain-containing protein [Candidatus Hydrogenedentes bacterium]|nr:SPFH domain-containing protein [Candidatus Hydrogenedentota bacterium]
MPDKIYREGPGLPKDPLGVFGRGVIRPHIPALPRGVKLTVALLFFIGIVCLVLMSTIVDYVKPYEFGIKQVKIGVKRGVLEKVYTPGYWFVKPFGMEKMFHFPKHLQVLDMTITEKSAVVSPSHAYDRAVKIQTSDGFFVDVDVTILYRIVDAYKVMTTLGPEQMYLTNGILPKAEPILKQSLGELNTEDFYNSPLRTEKAEMARTALDNELKPKGMKVEQILIRYFKYSDEIQKNIEAKKLQDQLVFKNQAEAKANTEEAMTKKIAQEGEMKVKITLQEGEAYKTEKMAEQELYTRKRAAEATLLVKTADAEATQLKNDAMQVAGYDRKVAMEMAKALDGLECVVVPTGGKEGVNPLDLDGMLQLFGVQLDPAGNSSPPASTSPPPPPPPPPVVPESVSTNGGAVQ